MSKVKFKYNPKVYNKVAGIYSEVTESEIILDFVDQGTCRVMQLSQSKYKVELNPQMYYVTSEQIFYTCEEHELAHILFESDMILATKTSNKMKEKYGKYGITFDMAFDLFNVLEDQRIESCWIELYCGSRRYFIQLRDNLVTRDQGELVGITLAARCNKPEFVDKKFDKFYQICVNCVEKVERTSFKAVIPLVDRIIKAYIEYIKDQCNEDEELQSWMNPDSAKGFEEGSSGLPESSMDSSEEAFDNLVTTEPIEEGTEVPPEVIRTVIENNYLDNPTMYKEESKITFDHKIDIDAILATDIDVILEEARGEFEEKKKQIEEKVSSFATPSPTVNTGLPIDDKYDFGTSEKETAFPDYKRLQRIFNRIRIDRENNQELGYAGELDMDEYIQFVMGNGDPDIFLEDTEVQKLNIILLLDVSTSMASDPSRLKNAKRVCLTISKAVKPLKRVSVDTWLFSGLGETSPVKQVNIEELSTVGCNGCTHTNDAVRFVTQQPKYKGKKNLIFIITDGMPYSINKKYGKMIKTKSGSYISYVQADTHNAINNTRQRGWRVFTFFIGNPSGNSAIFGRPFVIMKNNNFTEVLHIFEAQVKKFLNKR